MPCYNPIAGYPDWDNPTKNGKIPYRLEGRYNPGIRELDKYAIKIPCGKCLGCRLDYSRSWADRMILELASMPEQKAIFATLTYDNDHVTFYQGDELEDVPIGFTLVKKDVQDFFKRLRKTYRVRFYLCGEYGPKTHRPHYHAIIFGISLSDFTDLRRVGRNELGQDFYTSSWFEDKWQNGFVALSDVSYKTCAYVSRYVMKKAFVQDFDDGRQQEFVLMSRRPGLGAFFYYDDPERALNSHIFLSTSDGSKKISVPKYFLNKVKEDFPREYERLKYERIQSASDRELLKLQNTDLSYIDMLEVEFNDALARTSILNNRKDV